MPLRLRRALPSAAAAVAAFLIRQQHPGVVQQHQHRCAVVALGHPHRPLGSVRLMATTTSGGPHGESGQQQDMLLALAAEQERTDDATDVAANADAAARASAPEAAAAADGAPALSEKELRKLRKKEVKAQKRARRAGEIQHLKPCDLCKRDRDLLIRCQIDETLEWFMVCPRCWKGVSGGVPDGTAEFPHYRYGGLWKAR